MVLAERDALEPKTFYALPKGDARIEAPPSRSAGRPLSWSAWCIEELKIRA